MRQDTEQSLRTALCLTNPTGLQAGRWRDATAVKEQSLRTALCLTNPTGLQAGRWRDAAA